MNTRFARTLLLGGLSLMLLVIGTADRAAAQKSRSLDVGPLRYNTNEAFTNDDIDWPRDRPWTTDNMLDTYGIIIGARHQWTDPSEVPQDFHVAQAAHHKFTDQSNVVVPVEDAFRRIYRNPFPSKVIDGEDMTDLRASSDPVNESLPADAVIYHHAETWPNVSDPLGIDVERWTYSFAGEEHGNYVLVEYRFTNNSGEARDDVYFGITAETSAHTFYPGDIWGSYYGATYRDYVAGDPNADSMRVWYSWDSHNPSDPDIDRKGNPNSTWGVFGEPQFMTHAVVHADERAHEPGVAVNDDPAQPQKAGFSQRELSPNLNEAGHDVLYDFLSAGWDRENPRSYATTVDENGQEVPEGKYRVMRSDRDLMAETVSERIAEARNVREHDPVTEQEKTNLMSFGPYQMEPGEEVRIVTAFAGGAIPLRQAIDLGRAYDSGFSNMRERLPLPYDIRDILTDEVIASEGETLSLDVENDMLRKDAIINLGKELAFEQAARAIDTWKNGSVMYGGEGFTGPSSGIQGEGSFSIDLAPAAPSLTATSELDQIRLEWGDEAETDQRVNAPIAKYRIYRDYKRPPGVVGPTDTTFVLIDSVSAGQERVYVDDNVVRGEEYYYYLTAVTDDGRESSRFLNRTGTSSDRSREAVEPKRPPSENWQEEAIVVPNPYHARGSQKYSGRRLNFMNLPANANIHIYTSAGDLVQTLEHRAGTGESDWQRQITFNTLEIVSGIYIYVVEEVDENGNPTGQSMTDKFVVIK